MHLDVTSLSSMIGWESYSPHGVALTRPDFPAHSQRTVCHIGSRRIAG